jgi:hypothetical protein
MIMIVDLIFKKSPLVVLCNRSVKDKKHLQKLSWIKINGEVVK